jgi:ribonuclease T2
MLNYMQFNWKNSANITGVNGTDADLWAHEWNKHGTCLSTLQPECYQGYDTGDEVVDYFEAAIDLSKLYPTDIVLEACGIMPSDWRMYTLKDVEDCLTGYHGVMPRVGCDGEGSLNEVWWYHYFEGSVKRGDAVAINSTAESNCPKERIRYLPKSDLI